MFILEIKYEDETYGIRDTDDGSLDRCTRNEIKSFLKQGFKIQGVTVTGGKVYLRPVKADGFKNTAIKTVKSASKGNDMSVFSMSQRQAIEDYYIWETVSLYRTLAKSIRLDIKESKVLELTKLRGNCTWEFGGIHDTGSDNGGTCALGHSLRYEYVALGYNEGTGATDKLIFGETCASDFLNLPKDDLNKLVKVRKTMTSEIAHIIECIKNRALYESEMKSFNSLISFLNDIKGFAGSSKVLNNFLSYFSLFLKNNLVFPESMVKSFSRFLCENKLYLTLCSKLYAPDISSRLSKYDILPESDRIYQSYSSCSAISRDSDHVFATYVDFFFSNRIQGVYAYDPINEVCKSEGGFSKRAKAERQNKLDLFESAFATSDYNYAELRSMLSMYTNFSYLGVNLAKTYIFDNEKSKHISSGTMKAVLYSLVHADGTPYTELEKELVVRIYRAYVIRYADTITKQINWYLNYVCRVKRISNTKVWGIIESFKVPEIMADIDRCYQSHIQKKESNQHDLGSAELNYLNKLLSNTDKYDYYDSIIENVANIISKVDKESDKGKYILKNNPILIDIANTIFTKERCSERQLYFLNLALTRYMEYKSENGGSDVAEKGADISSTSNISKTSRGGHAGVFDTSTPVPKAPTGISDKDFIF